MYCRVSCSPKKRSIYVGLRGRYWLLAMRVLDRYRRQASKAFSPIYATRKIPRQLSKPLCTETHLFPDMVQYPPEQHLLARQDIRCLTFVYPMSDELLERCLLFRDIRTK